MGLRFQIIGINKLLLTVTAHKLREFWIRNSVAEDTTLAFHTGKTRKLELVSSFLIFQKKEDMQGHFHL